jgi:hypothetical protein
MFKNDLKKVMQRIVKRFLLHKQRESDEINEFDLDELKQDLQMIRYEMNNDSKRAREEIKELLTFMNGGIKLIGEYVFQNTKEINHNDDLVKKFAEYKNSEIDLKYKDEDEENDNNSKSSNPKLDTIQEVNDIDLAELENDGLILNVNKLQSNLTSQKISFNNNENEKID